MKRYTTLRENRTGASGPRRLLAVACVACLVFLQCFMLFPALDEDVHASDKITLNGYTVDGASGKDSYGGGDDTVEGILDSTGLNTSDIADVGCGIGELKMDDEIVKEDGEYYLYKGEEEGEEGESVPILEGPIDSIDFYMKDSYTPVEDVNLHKIGDIKKGKSKTLKYGEDYTASGDSFFKDDFYMYIEADVTGDVEDMTITDKKISFTANDNVGGKITVKIKERIKGKSSSSKTCKIVSKSLTASPSSLTLNVGSSSTVTVKDDAGVLTSSQYKMKSNNSKVASVSNGIIRGVKAGSTTIKITSNASTSKGLTTTVKVKVKGTTTTRYTTRSGYTGYRPTTRSGGSILGTTTRSGATTTATRPTETQNLVEPSFQTITVKEVFLTPASQTEDDVVYYDEYGNPIDEEEWNEDGSEEEEWDEDGVSVPAAAGSAAAAAAVCGIGAVGRVRRFRFDMSDAAATVVGATTAAAGEGGKRKLPGFKKGGSADAGAADAAGKTAGEEAKNAGTEAAGTEKKESKNPLKKFRRK